MCLACRLSLIDPRLREREPDWPDFRGLRQTRDAATARFACAAADAPAESPRVADHDRIQERAGDE